MPDAGRQIWEIRVPKDVELTSLENKMSKNKTKTLKKELRELENQRKNDEKKEMNEKTMKNDLSWNDPWSDHPEIQFGPIYPFFRNHKLWPTLHTWKVHFDRMWIFRLKRFFLREFSPKIILINHSPVRDKFWIFKCIIRQPKNENKNKE